MIASIRAEFRKLLTVRSTYGIVFFGLAIIALFAGFGDGFRGDARAMLSPDWYAHESYIAMVFVGLIFAICGLLLFGNEYRYNSILYTLTSSNSRLKSLLAKLIVISVFAVVISALTAFFSPFCNVIGAHLAGKTIGPQHVAVWTIFWRCALCGWGYAMYAFAAVAILRSQVGSIVTFLMVPLIGENIIMGIFKDSAKYLPFSNLQAIALRQDAPFASLSHSVTVVCLYIAGLLLISTVLFIRRDAN